MDDDKPTADIAKAYSEVQRYISENADSIARDAAGILTAAGAATRFASHLAEVGAAAAAITAAGTHIAQQYTAQIAEFEANFAPALAGVAKAVRDLPDRQRVALRSFAEHGWYLDPDLTLPDIFDLAQAFGSGDAAEAKDAENALCQYFDDRCAMAKERLCKEHPKRERLLGSAFDAHDRKDYPASILLFLSQADGVCLEMTTVQVFQHKKLAAKFAGTDVFLSALLSPLFESMPLNFQPGQRAGLTNILNRHAILHGESTDYDTRVNSCRAMSLLIYVVWVLQHT